ncbi:unnamed protein product [Thelazia callipaeda]|uniref:GCV_T domain-containing protein n=1 Tax=Thelazia callipaeda TaxID=103827 RepID=A0A0N5CP52_THECL|nr:unnamed protein product [Thelazia callipaeda]
MTAGKMYRLGHRGLLRLKGKDVMQFLQGLVTNDIRHLADGQAQYALMLNSRGRVVEDFILYRQADDVLVESDRNKQADLQKLLELYKVHKDVSIDLEMKSYLYHMDSIADGSGAVKDPRVPSFGMRILRESIPDDEILDGNAYHERRFDFGIPEGTSELSGELPLSMNADIMNGISSDKGCYLGQEMTARAINALEIRKRLLPFTCKGVVTGPLIDNEGRHEGRVVACNGRKGLALVPYLRDINRTTYMTKNGNIEIFWPFWWPSKLRAHSHQTLS